MFKRTQQGHPLKVIFDPQARPAILEWGHDKLGHRGIHTVMELLRQRFYWPYMHKDVHDFISSCHDCQIRNLIQVQIPPTISQPTHIMQKVFLDVMFMPPSGGFIAIVAIKDDLTGITEARALRQVKAEAIAKFLEEEVYCRYGVIGKVITDNGSEVQGAFRQLTTRLGIPHVAITPYNKHANGQVERGHYILREAIIRSCEKEPITGAPKQWHTKIRIALFADRVTINSATGYSPYYLLHGVEPVLPLDLLDFTCAEDIFPLSLTTAELLTKRIRQLERREEDITSAVETLQQSRIRNRDQFNKRYWHRLQKRQYDTGELVLVRDVRYTTSYQIGKKTNPRYLGPYLVRYRTQKGNYQLSELDGTVLQDLIAGFRIIPYITRRDGLIRILESGIEPNHNDTEDADGTDDET